MGPNPSQLWFTITMSIECDATNIHHRSGQYATIFQSGTLAGFIPSQPSAPPWKMT
jgi:hypothetical protein